MLQSLPVYIKRISQALAWPKKCFCDMDDTLTDWTEAVYKLGEDASKGLAPTSTKAEKQAMYDAIEAAGTDFWAYMDWKEGGKELWDFLQPYNPVLLSSPGLFSYAGAGKVAWIADNMPGTTLLLEPEKFRYSERGALLIDDAQKNIDPWIELGGMGILHKNTSDTIEQVKRLNAGLRESAGKIVNIGEKRMEHYHPHLKILLNKALLDRIRTKYLGKYAGIDFYFVDGNLIREKVDIDGTLGYNPGRYRYVPEGEIWMEETPEKEDHPPTFLHEYVEMRKMIDKGWSYDKAHDFASKIEEKYRLKEKIPSKNPLDDLKE